MIIRGTVIPLGKINRAKNPWGIQNSTTEINRLLKSMDGRPVRMCKECVSDPKSAHACDLDPSADVGTIVKPFYDRNKNAICAEVKITDPVMENKIRSGHIKKAWSPDILSESQDENGYLHGTNFDVLTIVGNPAFDEATYDIVSIAEAGEEDTNEDTNEEEEEPKKKGKLNVNKKKADDGLITLKKEDLAKYIAEEVAKLAPKQEEKNPPKADEGDDNKKPEGQFLTREQIEELLAEKKLETQKEIAIQKYQDAALAAGVDVDDDDLASIMTLPLKQIQKLTENYSNMASKIPVKEKRSNKPTYYNKENGTGGMDGSTQFTVGYPDDNGNWVTKQ